MITTTGTIAVTANNTVTLTSAPATTAQTVCINTPITNITYSTTGATGATVTNLPTGVTGTWAANVVTISGTPTVAGAALTYTVTLTGGCGVITTTGTIAVAITLPVSVTIAADANPVCAGTTVNFTATPTNGGAAPVYQWKVNGVNAGINAATYSYIPVTGDVVTVDLTSNAVCPTGNPATSAPVTMTVNPCRQSTTHRLMLPVLAEAHRNCYSNTSRRNRCLYLFVEHHTCSDHSNCNRTFSRYIYCNCC